MRSSSWLPSSSPPARPRRACATCCSTSSPAWSSRRRSGCCAGTGRRSPAISCCRVAGAPFFGVGLTPGHQLHLDEWVNSPIERGSEAKLASGMAFQVDVIPATGTDYFTSNIEDGIALADDDLRARFAARYPEAWARIE